MGNGRQSEQNNDNIKYCSKCGAKNELETKFCERCGLPFKSEKINLKNKNVKIILGIVVLVLLIFGISFKVLSDTTNPVTIAEKYMQSLATSDWSYAYDTLNLKGDKTFVSEEIFQKIMEKNIVISTDIVNYKVADVLVDDLSASVTFLLIMEGDPAQYKETIYLIKENEKKYLFFDDWRVVKISDATFDNLIAENYEITVMKDSKLMYEDIEITDKYINKEKSTDIVDVYTLPQVISYSANLNVELPNGLELNKTISPGSNASYTVTLDDEVGIINLNDNLRYFIFYDNSYFYINSVCINKTIGELKTIFPDYNKDFLDIYTYTYPDSYIYTPSNLMGNAHMIPFQDCYNAIPNDIENQIQSLHSRGVKYNITNGSIEVEQVFFEDQLYFDSEFTDNPESILAEYNIFHGAAVGAEEPTFEILTEEVCDKYNLSCYRW